MGIKSFFKNLGRSIKKGFNSFVAGAGTAIGGAATFLQRKAIPAIASGATKAAGLLDKAAPVADAAGVGGEAAEASQVLGKVGDVVGKFGKFIGSDIANQPVKVANAEQIAAFQQSPLGLAFKRSQTKAPAPAPAPAPMISAPKPSIFANIPMQKGLISPAPPAPFAKIGGAIKPLIGSNPATYTPKPSSGIESTPANNAKITVASGGAGGLTSMIA